QANQPLDLYPIPDSAELKTPKIAPHGNLALDQFFGGSGSLYRLSLTPDELKSLSSQDVAQLLQQEIQFIQPEIIKSTSPSAVNSSAAPQYISLISLLGVEKAN
ncbi:MAG: hypothetical protein KKH93_06160, partial [Candidatus Omnitrophica bacterium]|nr:hypothetical protein [Candidatus Omnitrophota bacterium]